MLTIFPNTHRRTAYVPELDGLRAIAIGTVMFYHVWRYEGESPVGTALSHIGKTGWIGVDIFFVISGYLITNILLHSRQSEHYFRNFYVRRTLRIFPLYYAVMTLIVAAALAGSFLGTEIRDPAMESVEKSWVNFLYLSNFAIALKGYDYVPMDISWSLAVEEQYYLLYPVLVFALRPSGLFRFLIAAVLLAPLCRIVAFQTFPVGYLAAYTLPFCRMDALALGGMVALWARTGDRSALRRFAAAALPLWVAAAVVLALVTRKDFLYVPCGYSLVAAATAATIAKLLEGEWRGLGVLLRSKPMVSVGAISYGLYLFHLLVRALVDNLGSEVFAGYRQDLDLAFIRLVIIIAGSLGVAGLSWALFEKPILQLKQRFAPYTKPVRPSRLPGDPLAIQDHSVVRRRA